MLISCEQLGKEIQQEKRVRLAILKIFLVNVLYVSLNYIYSIIRKPHTILFHALIIIHPILIAPPISIKTQWLVFVAP